MKILINIALLLSFGVLLSSPATDLCFFLSVVLFLFLIIIRWKLPTREEEKLNIKGSYPTAWSEYYEGENIYD